MNTKIMLFAMFCAIVGILNELGILEIALNVISKLEHLFTVVL